MWDQSPITDHDTSTSDLSPWQHIDCKLWHNRNACEICYTVKHQFCHKLHRDHQGYPSSGEYFHNITWFYDNSPEEIMIVIKMSLARLWLICYCHYLFIGTFSSGFIYIYTWLCLPTIRQSGVFCSCQREIAAGNGQLNWPQWLYVVHSLDALQSRQTAVNTLPACQHYLLANLTFTLWDDVYPS